MMESAITTVPGSGVLLQAANWKDLNAVRKLEKACFPVDAWPLWDLIGVLTLPNIVRLKAVADGEMVGFIAGEVHDGTRLAWVSTVGVLPEYRRQGVGTALLLACEAKLGARAVRLSVRRSNAAAIRLYERLEYQQVEVWAGYYQDGEDAIVLEKLLG
jgi:ribosomal-protein-alanine N-acetyltransferase